MAGNTTGKSTGKKQETWHSGYVLHSRLYQENSLIVDVLTADTGRSSVIYRGARTQGKKNQKGRLLQPFQPLLFSWSGDHELKTGRQVESNGLSYLFQGATVFSALYVNELVIRLLPKDEPSHTLFEAYEDVMQRLQQIMGASKPDHQLQIALRQFELTLLADMGYHLILDTDTQGNAIEPQSWYHYHPDSGFAVTVKPSPPLPATLFAGNDLLAIANETWLEPATLLAAKRLLRQALAIHLGSRPLKSRALFNRFKPSTSV